MKKTVAQKQYAFIGHAGYRQNEYLVILRPHEELRNKIMAAKEEFAEKFDHDSRYRLHARARA